MKTIIFDWKRTLYDPESKTLVASAFDLLTFLQKKHIPLVLIGKGGQDMYDEVKRLGVKKYFTHVLFREGVKDSNLFTSFIDKESPKKTIVVGDRVRSEIAVGNRLGATTIWFKQGKFAAEEPESDDQRPTFTITSLSAIKDLF